MRALGRHSFAVHNAMMILLVISLMLVGINSCPYLEELEATQGPRSPAAEWLYQIASDPQVQQVGYNPVLYKVLDKGQGPAHCQATDLVQVHYTAALQGGFVFDTAHARSPDGAPVRPATFPVNRSIPGLQDALTHMAVGAVWDVYFPAAMGYRDVEREASHWSPLKDRPTDEDLRWQFPEPRRPVLEHVVRIPVGTALNFRIELVACLGPDGAPKERGPDRTCGADGARGPDAAQCEGQVLLRRASIRTSRRGGSVSGVEVEADPAPEAECATTPGDYGEPPTRCPYKKVKRFVKRTIADLVSKMVMLLPHSGNTGS